MTWQRLVFPIWPIFVQTNDVEGDHFPFVCEQVCFIECGPSWKVPPKLLKRNKRGGSPMTFGDDPLLYFSSSSCEVDSFECFVTGRLRSLESGPVMDEQWWGATITIYE
jgi:hypothetical protein